MNPAGPLLSVEGLVVHFDAPRSAFGPAAPPVRAVDGVSFTLARGRTLGLVLTGGNIDTRLLSGVLTRQLAREGRLSQLRFDIVDRPGQLAAILAVLSKCGANIVEVSHQRIFTDLPAKAVLLEVVIETRDRSHLAATIDALKAANVDVDVGGGH